MDDLRDRVDVAPDSGYKACEGGMLDMLLIC